MEWLSRLESFGPWSSIPGSYVEHPRDSASSKSRSGGWKMKDDAFGVAIACSVFELMVCRQ